MGILDFLQGDPGSQQGGLFGTMGPLAGSQKTALLFSGLRDALADYQGRPAGNMDALTQQFRADQMRRGYLNTLGTLSAPSQPNEVNVTPQVQALPGGGTSFDPNNPAYSQPAMSQAGPLAGNPLSDLLKTLPPEQGIPALMSMMGPHKLDTVVDAQGVPHLIDSLTGADRGTVGGQKPLTFDPSKINLIPNNMMGPQGQDGGQAASQPQPQMNASQRNLANNNPGNMRVPGKQEFQTFPTMQAGVSAVTNQLGLYGKRGLNTVAGIISTYAPPTDGNDTASYIKGVASDLGVDPSAPLNMQDPHVLTAMTQSILKHEQGGTPIPAQGAAQAQPSNSSLPSMPGYTTIAPRPNTRPMTADELKQYNALPGSTINTVTGEATRATAYNSPSALDSNSIDSQAAQYNLTGHLPTGMGRGGYAAQQIIARADALIPPEIRSQGPQAIGAWRASNAQNYKSGQTSLTNFDQGKLGNQVRSFSVGLSHLDTLSQAVTALGNGDNQTLNKVGNSIANWSGKAAPANFNAVRDIVADEIVKAIVGSGGGVGDREAAKATINAAQSPQQLNGVIAQYKTLMGGQLHGLAQQYQVSTGRNDFASRLSPEAQAVFGVGAGQRSAPVNPASLPQKQVTPKILRYDAQGNRLQ